MFGRVTVPLYSSLLPGELDLTPLSENMERNIKLCEKCGFALYVGRAGEPLREVYRP